MRFVQEIEELEHTDTEITLGMRSLLGVFFGLVLICGVFFGLGYSLGRGGSAPAKQASHTSSGSDSTAVTQKPATPLPIAPPVNESVREDDASEASTYTPGPDAQEPVSPSAKPASLPKPSAGVTRQVAPEPEETAAAAPAKPAPAVAEPLARDAPARTSYTSPAPPSAPTVAASAPSMVQIAAISRQEDADVLVAALKKHGYNAVVRNDPKDSLLHVQVGPFATRDEARAMRAKLLNDGYNAILK